MVQRIDANKEDVVDNIQGAQRELLKCYHMLVICVMDYGVVRLVRMNFPSMFTKILKLILMSLLQPIQRVDCGTDLKYKFFAQESSPSVEWMVRSLFKKGR